VVNTSKSLPGGVVSANSRHI